MGAAACERVDPADVLFLIIKHLRLCGLSVSAMALLRESQIDTSWLCGPSKEMLLLREWVFIGDFARARTLLQPLASVLTSEELREAMSVIEKQELLESFFEGGDDDALMHTQRQRILDELRARKQELHVDESELSLCYQALLHSGPNPSKLPATAQRDALRQWEVHEARMVCFERLVPFFRGEIGPEGYEHKYLNMSPTQLMALVQDGVAYNNVKKSKAASSGRQVQVDDDCISIASESHKVALDQLEDASREHLYLGESSKCKQSSATAPSKNCHALSRLVDLSRMKDSWTSGGGHDSTTAEQIGSTFKLKKRQNPLAMSLDFDRAEFAIRCHVKNTELTVEEAHEDTDSEKGEVGGSASTPELVDEESMSAPMVHKVFCDSATQTEARCNAVPDMVAPNGLSEAHRVISERDDEEESPMPVVDNNASRVGGSHLRLSREPQTPKGWTPSQKLEERRSIGVFSLENELKMVQPGASFASDASRSVCIDDDHDDEDLFLDDSMMIENKLPISKYLADEELGSEGLEGEDEQLEQDPSIDQREPNPLAVVQEEPLSEERRPERYDQLTLDHIVRASVVAEVKEAHVVRAVDLNLDGSQLVIGTNARALRVFDLVSPLSSALSTALPVSTRSSFSSPYHSCFLPLLPVLVERHKHHQSSIYCVAFSNSNSSRSSSTFGKPGGGGVIASGDADSSIKVLSLATNKDLLIQSHPGKIRALHFAADNLLWSSATGDLRIRCWDLTTCTSSPAAIPSSCMDLDGHVGEIQTLAFSFKSSVLLSASLDKTVRLWDTRSGKCERIVARTAHPVFTLAFDPATASESRYFASGHQNGSVAMWDLRMKSHPLQTLAHHQDECRAISWSPGGKWLLSSSFDGTICLMQAQQPHQLTPMVSYHQHQDKVLQAQWHPTKPAIITTGADKLIKLWAFS